MISALITLIVTLIIVGIIWWAITQILPLIPLPEPFARIVYILLVVVLVLIVVYVLLGLIGAVAPIHVGRIGWMLQKTISFA